VVLDSVWFEIVGGFLGVLVGAVFFLLALNGR